MNCPVCGRKMEKGGIIADGAIVVAWHPESEFQKKGLKSFAFRHGKWLGEHFAVRTIVKIPDAWYCSSCDKVTGVFDVNHKEE